MEVAKGTKIAISQKVLVGSKLYPDFQVGMLSSGGVDDRLRMRSGNGGICPSPRNREIKNRQKEIPNLRQVFFIWFQLTDI